MDINEMELNRKLAVETGFELKKVQYFRATYTSLL